MKKKRVWIPILMSIAITFLITIQAVTHVQDERSRADVNQDGVINILDLVIVAKYLSKQEEGFDKEPISTSVKPALIPEQLLVEPPMPETEVPVYPEVTHANALDLKRGEAYRLRPSSYDEFDDGFGDSVIASIYWGTVDSSGHLYKGVSPDDPKTRVEFDLRDKRPYSQTLDGTRVIDWIEQDDGTLIHDEILIRIESERIQVIGVEHPTQRTGGPRGEKFTYQAAIYWAVPIENLTHPDRKFEYE